MHADEDLHTHRVRRLERRRDLVDFDQPVAIEADLRARGATGAPAERADVVIVNSCSVTANADQAVRQTVRRIGRVNPHAQFVVTGCYATRRPDEIRGLPNVLAVIGNARKEHLVEEVAALVGSSSASRFVDGDGPSNQRGPL